MTGGEDDPGLRPVADDDTTMLPAARGERRRRLEADRRRFETEQFQREAQRLQAEAAAGLSAAIAASELTPFDAFRPNVPPESVAEPTAPPQTAPPQTATPPAVAPPPVAAPPPVVGPAHSAGGAPTTSSLPVIRPSVRPPTPEEAPPPAESDAARRRMPSWDDTVTGSIPVIRERVNRERPSTPRHSASSTAVIDPAPVRDRTLTVLLAVVLVAVLSLVSGLYLVLHGGSDQAGQDSSASDSSASDSSADSPSDPTLLVVLDDGADTLVSAAVLGVDDGTAVCVLVPSGLQVDGLATGRTLLAQSLAGAGATPAQALSAMLRLRIDGTLRLSPQALARVVDAVGGLQVDVDTEVVAGTVVVPAGPGQRLDGAQAAAFAGFLAEGEPEEARLARTGAVVSALVVGLPGSPEQVGEVVRGLGAATSLDESALAGMLSAVNRAAAADGISATVLPVRAGTAGDADAYRLDAQAAATLLAAALPDALLPEPVGGVVRVLVRNAAGTSGLSEAARQRLQAVGLRFVGGGNADRFDVEVSQVLVPSGSAQDATRGRQVAAALGLPVDTIAVAELGTSLADVVVVLGMDFERDVADRGVLPSPSGTG